MRTKTNNRIKGLIKPKGSGSSSAFTFTNNETDILRSRAEFMSA
jgi:hypothetical protein